MPQLPAGDDLLELDLPFIAETRALATIPHPRVLPEPKRTFSLRSLVEGCFRYPLRFAAVAGLITLLTILAILFLPRRYRATMELAALSPGQYAALSGGAGDPAQAAGEATESDVNSQASLLRSRDLLSQALDQSGASISPPSSREKAIDDLARHLRVTPVLGANALQVSLTGSSTQKATTQLQAIASAFVSRELALLRPSHQQLVQAADQSQRQLAQAQQALASFKQTTGIASSADYEAALMRQLDSYAADSANLAAKLADVRQHRGLPQPQVLKARLAMLEGKRTQLLETYQVNDPVVLNVDRQITALRDRLARGDADPSTLEGKTQVAEHTSIDAQKHAYIAQLSQLQAQSEEFERLRKQVTEAQQTFDQAAAKSDQAAAADARDEQRMLGAVLAAKPSASSTPVQPRPGLYLAIGLSAAMLLAVLVCGYAETTRRTVCSAAELDALTGVPTLGTVRLQPVESKKLSRRRKKS
jgi:polysaccharide biosynthesis transport protein